MTPYYDDGQIQIYHGDCREVLPALGPVDLVLTDPPYGVKKRQRTYANANGPTALWDDSFSMEWAGLVSDKTDALAVMPGIANLLHCTKEVGPLSYRWTLAVHISNGMTRGPIGYGNWIPCLVYTRDGVRLYQQKNDIGRVSIAGKDRPDHPSPKPIAAMEWLLSRLPGELVLDPFMGSGTTLLAAKEAGRKAIGIEINKAYIDIAIKRLQQAVLPLEIPA